MPDRENHEDPAIADHEGLVETAPCGLGCAWRSGPNADRIRRLQDFNSRSFSFANGAAGPEEDALTGYADSSSAP